MKYGALTVLTFLLCATSSVLAETQEICAKQCVEGDCQNGPGLQVYANCDRYKGEFRSGQRDGKGEYRFANGDVYTGSFASGRRAGQGLYKFKKQDVETIFESSMDARGNGKGTLRVGTSVTECSIVAFVTECGQSAKVVLSEKMEPLGLVLYSGPGSSLQRGRRNLSVNPGDPVMPGDSLQSGRENLDMQFHGQVALRMKPNTAVSVGQDPVDRRVNLDKGEVIVKFEKQEGGLSIRAPAAHVQADGSTLSVRTTDKETDVKVFEVREGKVLVSPALPELEGRTRREIESDPALKKLEEKRMNLARPVAPNSTASIPVTADSAKAKSAEVRPFIPTVKEGMETRALVTADEKALKNAAEKPGDYQSREILLETYRTRSQTAIVSIEKDLAQTVLTSDADIMTQYGLIENLVLRSGKTIRGATITQAGDTLVVHSIRSTLQVRTGEIVYIDYLHKGEAP